MPSSRRNFIGQSAFAVFGISPLMKFGFAGSNLANDPVHPLFPTTHYEDARKIVGACHTQFDVVKEMVTARPELAKATHDWGFGDWESALGAASHMGRKDIAELLIEHGARPNIFTLAMLGKLEAVKAAIEAMPGIQRIKGPHGLTLLFHANMRLRRENVEGAEKEEQEALVEYLKSLGDANNSDKSLDISEEEQKIYLGKYVFDKGEDEYFNLTINRNGSLFMSRGEYTGRTLNRVDTHSFAPGGAPSVRIHFEVVDDVVKSLSIHDPVPVLKAIKI